jgi:hypothetical protein
MPDTEYNLADEMRRAADAIEKFNQRNPDIYHTDAEWSPSELRREAEHVDAEEREKAEREEQVEKLARDMFSTTIPSSGWDTSSQTWLNRARKLVEKGWRKDGLA